MIKFVKLPDEDNQHDRSKIIYKTDSETLEGVIEGFQDFLKACGYNFDGRLEIVQDEE
jgi:hypothetical protein